MAVQSIVTDKSRLVPLYKYQYDLEALHALKYTVSAWKGDGPLCETFDLNEAFQAFYNLSGTPKLERKVFSAADIETTSYYRFKTLRPESGNNTVEIVSNRAYTMQCTRVRVDVWEIWRDGNIEDIRKYGVYTTNPYKRPTFVVQVVSEIVNRLSPDLSDSDLDKVTTAYYSACHAADVMMQHYYTADDSAAVVLYRNQAMIPMAFLLQFVMSMNPSNGLEHPFGHSVNIYLPVNLIGPIEPPRIEGDGAVLRVYDQLARWFEEDSTCNDEVMVYEIEITSLSSYTDFLNWLNAYVEYISAHRERLGDYDPTESAKQHAYNNIRIDICDNYDTGYIDVAFTLAAIAQLVMLFADDEAQKVEALALYEATQARTPSYINAASNRRKAATAFLSGIDESVFDDVMEPLRRINHPCLSKIMTWVTDEEIFEGND